MLNVSIVAPDREVFSGAASGLRAPGTGGSFQVLEGHAPMIAAFETGPLFVDPEEGRRIAFATSGGFVEVLDDEVTVLAETAEPADEIDEDRAREAESRAQQRLEAGRDEVDRRRAEESRERARNRLRVSMGDVAQQQ